MQSPMNFKIEKTIMEQDDFLWLQKWYQAQCDGDWEHSRGIHLGTIDNPGWSLRVNLQDTELEKKIFQKIEIERSEHDWLFCKVNNNIFDGVCGSTNLPEVLKLFRNWAESQDHLT
jgi:hypothetical protein